MPTSLIARGRRPAIALAAAALALSGLAPSTLAADPLAVTTPYPAISIAPGSNPSFDLTVTAPSDGTVDLAVSGTPTGWKATLHGGGFVVTGVAITGGKAATARLDVEVPADTTATKGDLTITARKGGQSVTLPLSITVDATIAGDITLTTATPVLTGPSDSPFAFDLTLTNGSPEDQTVSATASTQAAGWTVTTKLAQANAASTVVKAGSSTTITVTATAPDNAGAGTAEIDVNVTAGTRSVTQKLGVQVTGTYTLTIETPNQLVSAHGPSGSGTTQQLVITNTGTSPLTNVKLASSAPTNWTVTFDAPDNTIPTINPGDAAAVTVTATITPSSDAVTGDYKVTLTATSDAPEGATAASGDIGLTFTVETSPVWLLAGVLLIVVIVAALFYVFRTYGRR
ncbi:MAG TPA: NEW3 domain-containing protein [Candidatus Limnocylindrales bacterium]|nr:NEW3 domain-containing protein [Candidatus Limnocylindrales bacterium]